MMKNKHKNKRGFSLIELLIVMGIFSVIAIVATETVALSLRSARKAKASAVVKRNLNSSVERMERIIRNARAIDQTCADYGSTPAETSSIELIDPYGYKTRYTCHTSGSQTYISSESGTAVTTNTGEIRRWNYENEERLTSQDIDILQCSFACYGSSYPFSASVIINLEAESNETSADEGARATNQTQVFLRSY